MPFHDLGEILEVGVHHHVGELVIIETATFELTIVEGESERLDEVEVRPEVCAKPDNVARVRCDLRRDERDV